MTYKPALAIADELTDDLRLILAEIANGKSVAQIGRNMDLTVGQVAYRVHQLFCLFGVNNRHHLVGVAFRFGYLKPDQVLNVHEQKEAKETEP
jgi:DNA-binding NarL/FixJ family response regulator